jgi:hypothetical protein
MFVLFEEVLQFSGFGRTPECSQEGENCCKKSPEISFEHSAEVL